STREEEIGARGNSDPHHVHGTELRVVGRDAQAVELLDRLEGSRLDARDREGAVHDAGHGPLGGDLLAVVELENISLDQGERITRSEIGAAAAGPYDFRVEVDRVRPRVAR